MTGTEPTSTIGPGDGTTHCTEARRDWIAARVLAGGHAVARSGNRAAWSDAAKDRLYGRMFPDDPGAERSPDAAAQPGR